MQKAFEKIVERLEEKISNLTNNQKLFEKKHDLGMARVCESEIVAYENAISIVDQVAEEYKQKLSICNNLFYVDMPQDFQNAVKVIMEYCQHEDCAYSCDDCSNCPNPLSVIRCGDTLQEEVCEWVEKSVDSIKLVREPHRLRLFHIEEERQYCPYCGKRIKLIQPKGE